MGGNVELWTRRDVPTGFWWENLKGRSERVILKWIYNEWNGEAWT
jgi:hypothetical protein